MKQKKYDFHWFEKEDRRSALRASVGKDGKLRLGRALKAVLPQFIRIGFDTKAYVLAIADGGGKSIQMMRLDRYPKVTLIQRDCCQYRLSQDPLSQFTPYIRRCRDSGRGQY